MFAFATKTWAMVTEDQREIGIRDLWLMQWCLRYDARIR